MARDYAKTNFNKNTPKRKRGAEKASAFLYCILGLLLVVLIGGVGYFVLHKQHLMAQLNSTSTSQKITALLDGLQPRRSQHRSEYYAGVQDDPDQAVQFDFYTELPKMHVKVAEATPAPAPTQAATVKPAPVATAISASPVVSKKPVISGAENASPSRAQAPYIVQLGVFKEAVAAERLRAKLSASGLNTDIVKITTKAGAMYRVQQGPFASFEQAKQKQEALAQHGIKPIIHKQAS